MSNSWVTHFFNYPKVPGIDYWGPLNCSELLSLMSVSYLDSEEKKVEWLWLWLRNKPHTIFSIVLCHISLYNLLALSVHPNYTF